MNRPTVHDIAKEAGVSLATVDRVLNARPGVRDRTIAKVQDAVARLGYVRDTYAANLARQRLYRFAVLVPDVGSQFLTALTDAIAEVALSALADRTDIRVFRAAPRDHRSLTAALQKIDAYGADGVAIMAEETPSIRDAILRLRERGAAVVTLVTDQPQADREHFVGIDNYAAGRTAAFLLGRFIGPRTGQVAVVVNSVRARDMVERRRGFDDVLRTSFPNLTALPSVEGRDDWQLTSEVTHRTLVRHGQVVGLYSVGAGNRGITQALEAHRATVRPVVIGHELTEHTRAALVTGRFDAVITQNVGHLARSAIRVLRARADAQPIIPSQERIRIDIVTKENLP